MREGFVEVERGNKSHILREQGISKLLSLGDIQHTTYFLKIKFYWNRNMYIHLCNVYGCFHAVMSNV